MFVLTLSQVWFNFRRSSTSWSTSITRTCKPSRVSDSKLTPQSLNFFFVPKRNQYSKVSGVYEMLSLDRTFTARAILERNIGWKVNFVPICVPAYALWRNTMGIIKLEQEELSRHCAPYGLQDLHLDLPRSIPCQVTVNVIIEFLHFLF